MRLNMATNSFNNNQHVKISLITWKVSAVCTVQQSPNVIKFHEAKLRPVSEKKLYTVCSLLHHPFEVLRQAQEKDGNSGH